MYKDREHAFVKIERDMKSGNIPGLVLLCGSEEYLTDHYRNALIDKLVEPAARQLDLTEFNIEDIDLSLIGEASETLPLMSEKKVILLDGLIDGQGRYPRSIEKSPTAVDELHGFLSEIPEQTTVIITVRKPIITGDYKKQSDGRKLSRLMKVVTKAGGSVYEFDTLERAQLRNFAKKRFNAAGKTCTNGVMQRIVYDTGYGNRNSSYDLYLLDNDLKKMIAISGEKATITEDDLVNTLTISPENNVFSMLDALGQGRKDRALVDLNTLLEDGESAFAILSNVVKQTELMFIARELMDESHSRYEIIDYLEKEEGVRNFRSKKVVETATRFKTEQLKTMFMNALAVEENIKGGIMDARLALEYFVTA